MKYAYIFLFIGISIVYSQDSVSIYIPKNIDETHNELSRLLPDSLITKIKNSNEKNLAEYHFGIGMWIRNNWGLWHQSRLSKYFDSIGIHHPDDMSGVIIETFWKKLNSKPINLNYYVSRSKSWEEKAKHYEIQESIRVVRVKEYISKNMLRYKLNRGSSVTLKMQNRKSSSLRNRYFASFNKGLLLTVRTFPDHKTGKFNLVPYFLDLNNETIRKIQIPEIGNITSAICIQDTGYFIGHLHHSNKLIAISSIFRKQILLPDSNNSLQLGINGDTLLAIYSNTIYQLVNNNWQLLYRGKIKLPLSEIPPRKYFNKIYFRDIGLGEDSKKLWLFELGNEPEIIPLIDKIKLVGSSGPRWEYCFDYLITSSGVLWAAVGDALTNYSLLKIPSKGNVNIAIMNGNNDWKNGELIEVGNSTQNISISGLNLCKDGSLIGVGEFGIYHFINDTIYQLFKFDNTRQDKMELGKEVMYAREWIPSKIYVIDENSYAISGEYEGIYLLKRKENGEMKFIHLDNRVGLPIVF